MWLSAIFTVNTYLQQVKNVPWTKACDQQMPQGRQILLMMLLPNQPDVAARHVHVPVAGTHLVLNPAVVIDG